MAAAEEEDEEIWDSWEDVADSGVRSPYHSLITTSYEKCRFIFLGFKLKWILEK